MGDWIFHQGTRMRLFVVMSLLITTSVSALEVPVDDLQPWTILSFNKIPPNEVSVDEDALLIRVRSSASPLIYRLDKPTRITGFSVGASWTGDLGLPEGAIEGDRNADDFVLKFGIVESGDQRLNWLQRKIAADWIKQLFRLAPKDSGVRRIHFLSTTQQKAQLGAGRIHPLSDLIYETRITFLEEQGPFSMNYQFKEPVDTLALWLSADGDDTGSSFDLRIGHITLHTSELPKP